MQRNGRDNLYRLSAAVLPLLVFWAVYEIVLSLLQILTNAVLNSAAAGAQADFLLLHAADVSAVLSAVAMAVAAGAVARTAGAEIRAFGERQKHMLFRLGFTDYVRTPLFGLLLFVVTLCLYLGMNLLLSVTGLAAYSGNAAARQSSVNFSLGLACYGVVTPFAEELAFRGLTLSRSIRLFGTKDGTGEEDGDDGGTDRRHTRTGRSFERRRQEALAEGRNLVYASLFSSALFGLWHGNLAQGILGFILGMVFCAVYYLTGSFPLVFAMHAAANTIALLLMQTGVYNSLCTPVWCAGFLFTAAAGCCCVFVYLRRR